MKSLSILLFGILCILSGEAGSGKNRGRAARKWKTTSTTTTTEPPPTTTEPPPTTTWTTTTKATTTKPPPTTTAWKKSKSSSEAWKKSGKHSKNNSKRDSKWKKSKSSSGAWKKSSSGGQWKKSSEGTWYKPPPENKCPFGLAQMWFGNLADIPPGYQICDGTNNTPDLRDRLVIGAGSLFPFASVGGASSITLSAAQVPAHTHEAGGLVANSDGEHNHHLTTTFNEGGHSHSFDLEADLAGNHKHKIDLETELAGEHDHTFDAYLPVDYNSADESFGLSLDKVDKDESYAQVVDPEGEHAHSVNGYTQMSGQHVHSISGTIGSANDGKHFHTVDADTDNNGAHTHSISGATGSAGLGEQINIMNPYHSLYFICCGKKTKAGYY